jgi:hypothetical protein
MYRMSNVPVHVRVAIAMVLESFLPASVASREIRRQIQKPVRPKLCPGSHFTFLIVCIDKVAVDKLNPGDAVVIFTPDSKCLEQARNLCQFAEHLFFKRHALCDRPLCD